MAGRNAPVYTVVLRNGVTVQFESNNVEIKPHYSNEHGERVTIKASAKNNGLSLMFARADQIDAIIKDTRNSPAEPDADGEDGE